jgi:long-subunit acyl-CoA synthetase (AMP-forming)
MGIMAIEMIGSIYCPLSPRDPQYCLDGLMKQTQSSLVLVHWLTKSKFSDNLVLLEIDSKLMQSHIYNDIHVDRLSNIMAKSDSIAYIIFTSGSTGTPKAVS